MIGEGVVERLGAEQVGGAVSVLCDAFADYPVLRFVLGRDHPTHLELLVRFFTMARVLRGEPVLGIRVGPELAGVALVSLPDGGPSPPELLALREAVWAELGANARARYDAFTAATRSFALEAPHVHLNMVGVPRGFRRRGLARLLIEEVQAVSRDRPQSAGVSLTTEDPANVPFYEQLGFELVGHLRVSPELESWGFFRRDRLGPSTR